MKKAPRQMVAKRVSALAVGLFLLLGTMLVYAAPAQDPVLFSLVWNGPDGNPSASAASRVTYTGYDTSYWFYADAPTLAGASLMITDQFGQYPGGFALADGTPLSPPVPLSSLTVTDAGASLAAVPVDILARGANGETLATYKLYFSTTAPIPEDPAATGVQPTAQPQVNPVDVTAQYIDQATGVVMNQETRTLQPGANNVAPQPGMVGAEYEQVGEQSYNVTVTASGPDMNPVAFYYQKKATTPPVQAVDVTVQYIDQATGVVINQETRTLQPGANNVAPQPGMVGAEYEQVGDASYTVQVTESGADKNPVAFYYQKKATPEPQVNPVDITVQYIDGDTNTPLNQETRTLQPGPNTVAPQPGMVSEEYGLVGDASYEVNVTASGADKNPVVFTYQKKAQATDTPVPATPPTITISYVDVNNQPVAPVQQVQLPINQVSPITAAPQGLNEQQYRLVGSNIQEVSVDGQGVATPAAVQFQYEAVQPAQESLAAAAQPVAQEQPAATPIVDNSPINLWGFTNTTSVNFRKAADKSADTIATLTKDSKVFVYQQTTQGGAAWFEVLSENRRGFIMAEFVTLLSAQDSAAYDAALPSPVPAMTPAPVPATEQPPVVSKPVPVTIQYLDANQQPVASAQTKELNDGTNPVEAAPADLKQGYVLDGDPIQYVIVKDNQANPAAITFYYKLGATQAPAATASPAPAPKVALVYVYYRDQFGKELYKESASCTENVNNIITAKAANIPGNEQNRYVLDDSPQKAVAVSSDGVATPGELVFRFKDTQPQVSVDVHYRSSSGEKVAESQKVPLKIGTNDIYAKPAAEPQGYTLQSQNPQKVTLTEQGGVTPAEVVFLYQKAQAPVEEPDYQITPMDAYAYPTKDGINFRSAPQTAGTTAMSVLAQTDLVHILGSLKNEKGELWYYADVKGVKGFVRDGFVRMLSKEEIEKLFPSPQPSQSTAPAASVNPAPLPSQIPPPYQGYALTTQQVALRSGVSERDETILATLPADTLLYLWSQTYVNGQSYSSAEALAISRNGIVPDSALRRITNEEADYYRNLLKPQATLPPPPTARPQDMTGYAITMGSNVPMRVSNNTNSEIIGILPSSMVVSVMGQEYAENVTWHVVQYGARYGFIRADQLRMLNQAESAAYLNSLKAALPTVMPGATIAPINQNSPSSYGYISADKVRLRKEASTGSTAVKMMERNAFALVLGSVQQPDGLWYRINQGGTEGYVMGQFLSIIPIGQLSSYLQKNEYPRNPLPGSNNQLPPKITSVEDFNAGVWKNPSLAQVSYEPFNPLGSPTPSVEAIATPSPSPSPTLDPLPSFGPMATAVPTKTSSSFPGGLLAFGILAALGGGGYYAYRMYNENQRRAAQRAAQRRQQAQQPGSGASASPYTRPAGAPGTTASNFDPSKPRSAAYPPAPQGTQPTAAYRPQQPVGPQSGPGVPPAAGQGTAAYRPGAGMPPAASGSVDGGTMPYRPNAPMPPAASVAAAAEAARRGMPSAQPGAVPPQNPYDRPAASRPFAPDGGDAPFPSRTPSSAAGVNPVTKPVAPVRPAADGAAPKPVQSPPAQNGLEKPGQETAGEQQRRRRTDRRSNS